MSFSVDTVVDYESMLVGFDEAATRFESDNRHPVLAPNALFEALHWAVAMDERIAQTWDPDGAGTPLGWKWRKRVGRGAEVMSGVRFARNRAHHQRARAIEPYGGLRDGFREWRWVQSTDLPPGKPDPHGESVYRAHLQGRAVIASINIIECAFYTMQFLLRESASGGSSPR